MRLYNTGTWGGIFGCKFWGGGRENHFTLSSTQHIMVQVVTAAVAAIAFASLLILYEPSTSTTQLSAASMGTKLSKQTIQGSP